MPSKELRFALDEKGLKALAPTLIGQTISYWEDDKTLSKGVVSAADIERDRYGNPFIRVDIAPPGAAVKPVSAPVAAVAAEPAAAADGATPPPDGKAPPAS